MKKLTILTLILALSMVLTACGGEEAPVETTVVTVAATAPSTPAETEVSNPLALTDWKLHASTWSSPNGATIHITATPNYYNESQKADFVIRLENDDVTSVPCQWDGTAYTASADLNAANGYCYYVVFTAENGALTEFPVNTPAAPTNLAFIDLEAALESYCSMTMEESTFENNTLTLNAGKVQVKIPTITNQGETIICIESALQLTMNGEQLDRKVLTLTPAENEGFLEASLDNITFDIPAMENEQTVEVTLNVMLSNGHCLTAYGGNWIFNEEGLLPIVG